MALQFWLRALEGGMRLRGIRRRRLRTANGFDVSYHEFGRRTGGSTLLFLHGLATSSLSWVRIMTLMGKRHHVIALDLPGYGDSPLPAGREFATLEDAVGAVDGFLASDLAGKRTTLIGNSLGGWVAAKVARRQPSRVEQLVLVNTAGVLYPGIAELRQRLNVRTQEEVRAFWERLWYKVPRYYLLFWRDYIGHMRDPRITGFLDSVREADFINADLASLGPPTTIIWGRSDRFLPAESVDLMLQQLKTAQVYWMPKTGHIPQLESPRLFAEILLALLRRNSSSLGA